MKHLLLLTITLIVFQSSFAQEKSTADKSSKATILKAEKVEVNTNPIAETLPLPWDFPKISFDGNPTSNFYNFIQEKSQWYLANPEGLTNKIGITRVSQDYIESLPEEIKNFIGDHIEEFEILKK